MGLLQSNNSRVSDLTYNVTVSLMNAAVQACIDAVGYSMAFRALAPSIRVNADWCLSRSSSFSGQDVKGVDGLLAIIGWAVNMSNRGETTFHFTDEETIQLELKGCRTCGAFPHMCEWWCQYEYSMMCNDSNPNLIMSLERSLSNGDDLCLWTIKRKDGKAISGKGAKSGPLIHSFMSAEELDFWAQAGPAEFMTQATINLVELIGPEKALEFLLKRAREAGIEFGQFCARKNGNANERDIEADLALFDSLMKLESRIIRSSPLEKDLEAIACPFLGSPSEVCAQIEEFKRGVIEALVPEGGWEYDERRVDGEPCKIHLQLNARSLVGEGQRFPTNAIEDELLGILKIRLAKGDITEEEFDRLVSKLSKRPIGVNNGL